MNESNHDLPSLELLKEQFSGNDSYMRLIGAELVELGRGTATVRMTVRKDSLNFNGTCHGAAIFAIADFAFGAAANSYGEMAAGIDAHITFVAAGKLGETLTATAREVSRSRKLAVYRIDVTGAQAGHISSFTGTVYIMGRKNYS
jgi:acyl-CoA thioesterase